MDSGVFIHIDNGISSTIGSTNRIKRSSWLSWGNYWVNHEKRIIFLGTPEQTDHQMLSIVARGRKCEELRVLGIVSQLSY